MRSPKFSKEEEERESCKNFLRKKTMVVEETAKSAAAAAATTADDERNPTAANPNPNSKGVPGNGDSELEEGEIVGEEDSTQQSAGEEPKEDQPHPLEHSWTFWFDNPSAKSKQVAWGASMRPIYTFSTVEEFWR